MRDVVALLGLISYLLLSACNGQIVAGSPRDTDGNPSTGSNQDAEPDLEGRDAGRGSADAAVGFDAAMGLPAGGGLDAGWSFDAALGPDASVALPASGLDTRPSNLSCRALPRPLAQGGTLSHERLLPNVTLPNIVTDMKRGPLLVPSWFGTTQNGSVFAVPDGASAPQIVLPPDRLGSFVFGGEAGLLGLAIDPSYPNDEAPNLVRLFVNYVSSSCPNAFSLCTHVRRYDLSFTGTGSDVAFSLDPEVDCAKSPACEQILTVNQPADNHNGGGLVFGKDGYLYVSFGDGGGEGACNAQNLGTPLGKLFRLDVHVAGVPYAIPSSNPYATATPLCNAHASSTAHNAADTGRTTPCPEIIATGLRNPFRISVDRADGRIWIGDVGQNRWEEVDSFDPATVEADKPENFGWPRFEGPIDYNNQDAFCAVVDSAGLSAPGPYLQPNVYYPHSNGRTVVVGGYVYRGSALGEGLAGRYVLADVNGDLWFVPSPASQSGVNLAVSSDDSEFGSFYAGLYGFAEDDDGELVVFGVDDPPQRLVLSGATAGEFPTDLVDTGCVDLTAPSEPSAGLLPYDLNAPLWSDGADKQRYVAIPDGSKITRAGNCTGLSESACASVGDFELPIGSVVMKVFRKNGWLLETRLLMRHDDGDWAGYTYVWNAAQTAATLADGATEIPGQNWTTPSRTDCMTCHTRAAGRTLGLEIAQLNRELTYAATGRTANQLDTWSQIGLFDSATASAATLAKLAVPTSASNPELAARAYLHSNCANCHRPGTAVPSQMDLRYTTPLAEAHLCNVTPSQNSWPSAVRLLRPGHAADSLISLRTKSTLQGERMPPLGTRLLDADGSAIIDAWIESLAGCP